MRDSRIIDSLDTFDQRLVFGWTLLKAVSFCVAYLLAEFYGYIIDKLRVASHFLVLLLLNR